MKFGNFLKTRLIFILVFCFWMFVNKLTYTSRSHISKCKRCFSVKSLTYYFHVKTKLLAEFQICISVPLELKAFFPHNLIELFRNRKAKAWETNKQCNTWRKMIVEKRFICKNTRQLVKKKIHLFRGDKKQETSNKCIVAIKIKVRYIN